MTKTKSRREFIFRVAQIGALSMVGGAAWSALLSESKANVLNLRPPGALPENDYLSKCIKCGLCIDACPYDTLSFGTIGRNEANGVPKFEPRKIPCYMCKDVPCAKACPSGALDKNVEINDARMGLAVVIDQETCIAFQGLRCEVCYRVCPLMGKAITLKFRPQERTGKHAYFEPVVHSDACTGCGMCEHACILEEPAIKVLPKKIAQGKAGDHYKYGWKQKSNISKDFKVDSFDKETKEWEKETLDNALESLEDHGDLYE